MIDEKITDTEKSDAIRDIVSDCDLIIDEIDFLFDVALGTRRMISDRPKIKELAEKWGYNFRKEEHEYEDDQRD